MRSRISTLSAGEGPSSQTFWCRRCSEQSRSPRWMRVAVAVAEHLDLDVARLLEILFDVDRIVAEGGLGFGPGRLRAHATRSASVRATFMPRPPPPAAALMSTGIADVRGDALGLGLVRRRRLPSPGRKGCRGAWPCAWPRSCRP